MYLHFTNGLFASVARIQTNKKKTKYQKKKTLAKSTTPKLETIY